MVNAPLLVGGVKVKLGKKFLFHFGRVNSVHWMNPYGLLLNFEPPETCQAVDVHDEEEKELKKFEDQFCIFM